jgi:hypothetical protein
LELLLVASVSPRQIVWGQWRAMWRAIFLPALAVVTIQVGAGLMQIQGIKASVAANTAATGGAAGNIDLTQFYVMLVVHPIAFLTGLVAIVWFGMWMGLTSSKTNVAVIKTLVFCQVLPSIALTFLQWLAMFGMVWRGASWYWLPQVVSTVLGMAVDLVFIVVARRKLLATFRDVVTRTPNYAQISQAPPPAVLQPAQPPPPAA